MFRLDLGGLGACGEISQKKLMQWMIKLGRRNLPPQQRIAVVKKFEKKIQEQANEKYKKTVGRPKENHYPNGEQFSNKEKYHTDKELAKLAGVVIGTLAYETKEEVMEWMLDIQLGRRNLSPIQRITIAEKYRCIYEKQAKENQGTRNDLKSNIPQNLVESEKKKISKNREVNSKLAKVANVNPETYRQAKRILDSNNDDLKQRVQSGETSISAGYKELIDKEETIVFGDTKTQNI